jgi:diamine N-acetyltransferase
VLTGLRLEQVTPENVRAACKLKLRPDQEDLVAPVACSGPEGFYRRLGFNPTGEHNEDEVIAERVFSPDAATSS